MSQEESLYDLLHSERANALRNSEKFLAAVEYFKGREDIIEDRMKDLQENGAAALMSDETFSKILEAKEKELKVSKIFIWENMGDTQKGIFEDWFKETFEIDCKYLTENKGSILFSITNEVLENLDAMCMEDLYSRFTIFGIRPLEVAENIELTK